MCRGRKRGRGERERERKGGRGQEGERIREPQGTARPGASGGSLALTLLPRAVLETVGALLVQPAAHLARRGGLQLLPMRPRSLAGRTRDGVAHASHNATHEAALGLGLARLRLGHGREACARGLSRGGLALLLDKFQPLADASGSFRRRRRRRLWFRSSAPAWHLLMVITHIHGMTRGNVHWLIGVIDCQKIELRTRISVYREVRGAWLCHQASPLVPGARSDTQAAA